MNAVGDVGQRRAGDVRAEQRSLQVGLNQIELKADVEDAPFWNRARERARRSIVDAVREERAMQESDSAVAERDAAIKRDAVGCGAVGVRAEADASQLRSGIGA